ncbi:MAG: isoprenylcysteine carboxylmethyltransferase family protein [Proteobacteria bacterium]|nr:isoprenylcysteine carboxylmethyltransferase family protein [Pseudomonadota bacterium]
MSPADHLIYGALWLSFGAGHSMLAGATAQRGLGRVFGRWHRLAYNGIALVHIGAIYFVGQLLLAKRDVAWLLWPPLAWGLDVMMVAGVVLIVAATGGYRLAAFAGLAQLSGDEEDDDQRLRVTGLNRFVRHPLYTGVLMAMWGGVRSDFGLATAIWGTVYIVVGSRIEERRLLKRFGRNYAMYLRRVPALIPWRSPSRRPTLAASPPSSSEGP